MVMEILVFVLMARYLVEHLPLGLR